MIITRSLAKRYGTVEALHGLELDIRRGEVVALLGANGAGKTTTVKLLLGLTRPTAGRVEIDGLAAGHPSLRNRIGYCPEEPMLHDFLTVEEILGYYAELSGLRGSRRQVEVGRVTRITQIDDIRRRKAGKLSKGQAQRVSLAQSLLGDPPVLLLDEPTSGLDPIGRIAVRELIEHFRSEGKTVVLNSHMLSEVERTCDRAVILRQGRKVWEGTLDNLTTRGSALQVRGQCLGDAARRALADLGLTLQSDRNGWTVSPCPPSRVHDVAVALVNAGTRIEALIPKRDALESLFLELNPPSAEEEAARILHDAFETLSVELNGGENHVADRSTVVS